MILYFQILTKDSVTVFVSAIMWFKVKDATSVVANVEDYSGSAKLLAATTLRNVLGTRNLGISSLNGLLLNKKWRFVNN